MNGKAKLFWETAGFFFRRSLAVAILFFSPTSYAQQLTYDLRHYSTEDGLSDHRIYSVLEHSNGFVYVGTMNGLNRFDGYEFSLIKLPGREEFTEGTTNAFIYKLYELTDGKILIVFSYTDPITVQIADVFEPISRKRKAVSIHKIDEAKSIVYLENGEQLTYVKNKWKANSHSRTYDLNGNYIEHNKGEKIELAILHLKTGESLNLSEECKSLILPKIFGDDFSNSIYFSALNGLMKIDVHRSPFKTYLAREGKDWEYQLSCRAVASVGENKILLSTEQETPYMLNQETGAIKKLNIKDENNSPLSKPSINIRGIHPINDSTVWLTVWQGNTLLKLNLNNHKARQFLHEYMKDRWGLIHSIHTKSNKILIATYSRTLGNHLIVFDPTTEKHQVIDFASELTSNAPMRATYIFESRDGDIWLGTTLGLFKLDLKDKKIIAGYYSKNTTDKILEEFPQHYILEANSVLSISDSPDGDILIGMEGGGVNILNKNDNTIETINKKDGLANQTVCGILPDKNGYWFSTYHGLSFYDDHTKTIRNFYKKNGLPHNEFNRFSFFKNPDGHIIMGGMNGFVSFDPAEILRQNIKTKLLLSEASFFADDGKTEITEHHWAGKETKFIIPSQNRNCSFKVAMTDFKNTENHQYSFQLNTSKELFSNLEPPWISNGQNREIQFNYLPAGNHKLHIRGTSSQGILTDELIIQLTVKEFFYRTWWFFALCISGVSVLFYAFYKNKLANAIKIERLRTRLSSDLHDDVGSLLSGVAYQMELLEYSVSEKNKSLVKQIASSSRKAMSQMRDVVWAIDSRSNTVQDLTERIQEAAEEILGPLNIQFNLKKSNLPPKKELPSEIRHSLILIFKEFLTNTVKHAEATEVHCHIFIEGKKLCLSIQDNGKGMREHDKTHTGQGIENIKRRAEKIKGELKFIHKNGLGIELKTLIT